MVIMMDGLVLYGSIFHLLLVDAAPAQSPPSTGSKYASPWVDEPQTRGTWGILYSCIFTIGLCVWSAIHLNIPAPEEPRRRQFWRKIKWVFIAIFAPEIVLYTAWQQFHQARKLCAELNALAAGNETVDENENEREKTASREEPVNPSMRMWRALRSCFHHSSEHDDEHDPQTRKKPIFSLRFGYYAVMGGFAVNVHDIYDKVRVLVLLPSGILRIAQKSSWKHFHVSEEFIRDKSKADNVVKILVFVQVIWSIFQCIARAAFRYPITILEVHTLIHAVCALLMYGIWFRKPFDIGAPLMLDTGSFKDELALMSLHTADNGALNSMDDPQSKDNIWLGRSKAVGFDMKLYDNDFISPSEHMCEADFLLFDMTKLATTHMSNDSILHGCLDRDGEAITSSSYLTSLLGELDATDIEINSDEECSSQTNEVIHDIERNTGDAATQTHVRSRSEASSGVEMKAFSIVPDKTVKGIATIKTGQMFQFGLGPRPINIYNSSSGKFHDYGTDRRMLSDRLREWFRGADHYGNLFELEITLSAKDLLRWNRASRALASEAPNLPQVLARPKTSNLSRELEAECPAFPLVDSLTQLDSNKLDPIFRSPYAAPRLSNFDDNIFEHSMDVKQGPLVWYLASSFGLISGAYAAVHLALWNFDFPSFIECLLWKISASVMMSPLVLFIYLALRYSVRVRTPETRERYRKWRSKLGGLSLICFKCWDAIYDMMLYSLIFGGGFIYCCSRIYIVVESFISLRHVPLGVYDNIAWSQYVPHF